MESNFGTLYIVATPIGNLEDITIRAIRILKEVEIVLAEDTRSFGILKKHFEIETNCLSFFEQNEMGRIPQAIEYLKKGLDVAVVSEAGTPLISDPGFRLVKKCREESIRVSPIPGACAVISALSASGLETDQLLFLGFLPVKEGKKTKSLENALEQNLTFGFYESPHRIEKTLTLLSKIAPSRLICCAKEITKIHEDFILNTSTEVLKYLKENNKLKGEFCILVGKEPKQNN
jgi:16S rRNA (cytidine1402-2'-O)-methyltransferase